MRRAALVGMFGLPAVVVTLVVGCGGSGGEGSSTPPAGDPVAYAEVQGLFENYGCTGCHPGVNSSLDLREGESYDQLAGVPALEDPTLYRVVAGDPGKSFLYLKVGGDAPLADIPAIGTRMPPMAPPIASADLDLIRRWILQGAKGPDGRTGGPTVPSPGNPPANLDVAAAARTAGTATITGTVIDQRREPIAGALVTLLLAGPDEPGGEEHYRVAVTDGSGRFTLAEAPSGRFLLKAYAPNTIYVSRIVALEDGETQDIRFGLPDRLVENPTVSEPAVSETAAGLELSLDVQGSDLDPNYTLAVNPEAGLVFELHAPGDAPGRWSATIDQGLLGPWIFMAVDKSCNVSDFITLSA